VSRGPEAGAPVSGGVAEGEGLATGAVPELFPVFICGVGWVYPDVALMLMVTPIANNIYQK